MELIIVVALLAMVLCAIENRRATKGMVRIGSSGDAITRISEDMNCQRFAMCVGFVLRHANFKRILRLFTITRFAELDLRASPGVVSVQVRTGKVYFTLSVLGMLRNRVEKTEITAYGQDLLRLIL